MNELFFTFDSENLRTCTSSWIPKQNLQLPQNSSCWVCWLMFKVYLNWCKTQNEQIITMCRHNIKIRIKGKKWRKQSVTVSIVPSSVYPASPRIGTGRENEIYFIIPLLFLWLPLIIQLKGVIFYGSTRSTRLVTNIIWTVVLIWAQSYRRYIPKVLNPNQDL